MITKKDWQEFRESGLLFFINQILHAFGWAIVIEFEEYDRETDKGKIVKIYPARVKFRGFEEKSVEDGYNKIMKYLEKNVQSIVDDAKEGDNNE